MALVLLFTCVLANAKITPKQIQVRTEKVANSKFEKVITQITVQVPLEKLVKGVEDFNNYTKWYVDCLESKILSTDSETTGYAYFVNHLPWPYDNRDVINRFEIERGTDKYKMRFRAKPKHIPAKEDLFRIQQSEGGWDIQKLANGKLKIVYFLYVNPGNSLPGGLANSTMKNALVNSLANLLNLVKK